MDPDEADAAPVRPDPLPRVRAVPVTLADRDAWLAWARERRSGVLLVAMALVVAAAGWWLVGRAGPGAASPDLPRVDAAEAPPLVADPQVYVHVAGAVGEPGLYLLPAGARVADAVSAAGGFLAFADGDRLNLAAKVADGEQVYVPRRGEEVAVPTAGGASGAGPSGDSRVNLNQAGEVELQTLPGIGPSLAAAIVRHRDAHGPFSSVDQLVDVAGIGPAKLEGLRDQARV
ncbi:MAG TPA: helix-hairpin-helix domain-containing protein [Euzebya sp.]|nr:helix-hairpin-helix domain-containing protein [Euzebya sp.]